jgi:hypothetical protein
MATLITPSVIASSALATLYNTTVLLPLVNRDYDSDFQGKQGDTITVRTPASFTVNEFVRSTGIVLQDPTEGSITTEELTLELDRFEERLLNPAMEAISQDVDGRLAEALVDAANLSGGGGVVHASGTSSGDRIAAFSKARTTLGRNKLPLNERYAVLSPEGSGAILGDPLILAANTSGSTAALRDGAIGRIVGFDTYESQVFGYGANDKGHADGVAFHRSAVAAVTRTLETPMGVAPAQVSVQGYKGLGLRVVRDYDVDKKQDVISVDTLFGLTTIRKTAAVQLDFGLGS